MIVPWLKLTYSTSKNNLSEVKHSLATPYCSQAKSQQNQNDMSFYLGGHSKKLSCAHTLGWFFFPHQHILHVVQWKTVISNMVVRMRLLLLTLNPSEQNTFQKLFRSAEWSQVCVGFFFFIWLIRSQLKWKDGGENAGGNMNLANERLWADLYYA